MRFMNLCKFVYEYVADQCRIIYVKDIIDT